MATPTTNTYEPTSKTEPNTIPNPTPDTTTTSFIPTSPNPTSDGTPASTVPTEAPDAGIPPPLTPGITSSTLNSAPSLTSAPKLTSLSLKGQVLKLNTRADIEPLLEGVDQRNVEEICLSGNTLGVEAGEGLGEWLAGCEKIRVVDLSDIFTGRLITEIPLALTAICTALKDKTSLREINLSDNAFGGRSVDPLVPLLSQNTHIQVVRLNNNGMGPEGGKVVASALLSSAQLSQSKGVKSNLRVVVCGRNRLENGSAPTWAEAFAAHGTLEEVKMPQNGIRMEGIVALAHGLAKCPGLKIVDMQDNCFSDDGGKAGNLAWAAGLRLWTGLRELNLSDCVLASGDGDWEVPRVVEELGEGSNPGLRKLWLQNDNLGVEAFEVLAKGIEGGLMGGLRVLDLMDNDVDVEEEGEEVVGRLRAAMKGRKGRFLATDEDEDVSDDEEEEEEEEMEVEDPEKKKDEEKPQESQSIGDKLAELMKKVTLSS